MDHLYREFGRVLREKRKSAGFTQDHVAARIGLSRTSVTNIERGRQHVTLHVLYALADAIGAKPMELLPDGALLAAPDEELAKVLEKHAIPEAQKEWIQRLVSKSKA
jgi:transcriptional regulator with XRE-family HTH domain